MPCVAMAPPSLIDFILSRDLADGVAVAGCAESACYNRLGIKWTEQRFAGERDPYLRARVPRERIATDLGVCARREPGRSRDRRLRRTAGDAVAKTLAVAVAGQCIVAAGEGA